MNKNKKNVRQEDWFVTKEQERFSYMYTINKHQ